MVDVFDPESAGGRVYRALVSHPGCTTRELAQLAGLTVDDVRKTIGELHEARLVTQRDTETWDAERPDVVASASLRDHDAVRLRLRQTEDELMGLFRYARQRAVSSIDVEILDGRDATFLRFKKMQQEAHTQVRAIDRPPYYWDERELARQERLQCAQMSAGIDYRTIYQESERDSPVRSESMTRLIAAGEHARVLAEPPVKLTIVDETPALLALDPPAGAEGSLVALAVYSPGLVNALINIFESLWRLAVPANLTGIGDGLSSLDREILTLMASGATDEAISRRLQLSRRTVGRHTSGLLERLGASTRFQAGVQAARRGWL